MNYASRHYGVPADIGRRVTVYGNPGIIAEDRGHYLGVNFDADKPGHISNCHPTDGVVYGEMGTIRKMTRSQKRYRDYLRSESNLTFREWIGADKETVAFRRRMREDALAGRGVK